MVTRKTPVKRAVTRRRTVPATPVRHAPTVTLGPTMSVADVRARLDVAGRTLQTASVAATRFARSSVREVTVAARASREPVHVLWRTVRLAGRHIARDAVAAWHEVVPLRARTMKRPVVKAGRRPAA